MLDLDFARIDREFVRHIRAETMASDPVAMAATPNFEVEPVPLMPFLREQRFLGLPPLSDEQFAAVLHAERIYFEPTYEALGWEPVRMVNEIGLAWGKGPLAHDTPVMTPSGWKRHGDLEVGDEVIGGDGLPCRVLTVHPEVYEDCYRITFSDGESIVATGRHRWPMEWRERGARITTTAEMAASVARDRGKRNWSQVYPAPVKLPAADLEVDPYLLGLWLGDGNASQALMNTADPEVVAAFRDAGYRVRIVGGERYRWSVAGGFQAALRRLGVLGAKAVPAKYLRASVEQRLALLQGLLDSDGSVNRLGWACFHNTDRGLVDAVADLAASLGIGVLERVDDRPGKKPCWTLTLRAYREDFELFRLPRKLCRQRSRPEQKRGYSQARRVVSVEPVLTVPARCIEVDSGDHTYRVGRTGVVTCNSGKDYVSRIMLARAIYLLQCLESPQAYFGMPGSETIHVTNIATAAPQARFVFFEPWVRLLSRSPWFKDRMEPLTTSISFDKGLLAQSGHSSVESQEGQNLLMAVIDEYSGFKTAAELLTKKRLADREPVQSAEGIYKTALSSIRSRFPLTGKLIAISFTRFRNDPIDLLEKRASADQERRGHRSRMYGSRAATWEVNPTRSRSDFDDDFENDPLDAQCRYMCQPSASPHRYFQNLLALRRAMGVPLEVEEVWALDPSPGVAVSYEYVAEPVDEDVEPGWEVSFDFSGLPVHSIPCAIHVDLGITQDLAGVAMSHVTGWYEKVFPLRDEVTGLVEERVERRPRVKTDFVMAFEQQRGDFTKGIPGSDIQISWVRELIFALIRAGFSIRMVTMDGYQSTDTLQLLSRRGITAELYSLDRNTEGYDVLKSLVYGGDIELPFHPLAFTELESLVKVSDRKVDHQAGMSKDMADAIAGSVRGAVVLLGEGVGPSSGDASWSGGSLDEWMSASAAGGLSGLESDTGAGADYRGDDGDEFWSGGGISWRR